MGKKLLKFLLRILKSEYFMGLATGFLSCAILVMLMNAFGVNLWPSSVPKKIYQKSSLLYRLIQDYYPGELNEDDMVNVALKGMVQGVGDEYSTYYSPEEYKSVKSGMDGQYVGIGITIVEKNGKTVVQDVKEGGPAEEAGILKGDVIVEVNQEVISGGSISQVSDLIKNGYDAKEGSVVTIKVERVKDGKKAYETFSIKREVVETETVSSKDLSSEVCYIRITSFNENTDEQFEEIMKKVERKNQEKLILDLRDNGGGSVDATIHMLNYLLPKGDLITEKSKKQGDKKYTSDDKHSYNGKVVILINGNSASASEVFAGTMQARNQAKLVGTQSFGKGIVQTILSLDHSVGGALKITSSEYFLPNQKSIHKIGLTPDKVVEYQGSEGGYGKDDDNQLKEALDLINAW